MAGFVQQDGKIYVGTTGVAASGLVTTANLLAELKGNVSIEATWEKAESRWRTRAVKDRYAYAVDAQINVEELEFKGSNLSKLMTGASTGSVAMFGTTATGTFWRLTTSTAPKRLQFVFQFTKTDDSKRFQVYAPKAEVENFPAPFAVDDFTLQNLTFQLMATSAGTLIEFRQENAA